MNYQEAINLALDGSQKGYTYLFNTTYMRQYRLAYYYMEDEEMATQVLQEAYIKAFENLDQLKDKEKFSSWLSLIIHNIAKRKLLQKSYHFFMNDKEKECEHEVYTRWYADEKNDKEERDRTLIGVLLNKLPVEQKTCILMFYFEGRSVQEIAEQMNCSENTVKSRMRSARKQLKTQINQMKKEGKSII